MDSKTRDIPATDQSRSPVPDFDLVIFGATGDLAGRKLFPALWQRYCEGVLPNTSQIYAVGRSLMTDDDFRKQLKTIIEKAGSSSDIHHFLNKIKYFNVDFDVADSIQSLAENLKGSTRTRAFYLSISPDYFAKACAMLFASGLATPDSRIVVEKPIGRDQASATVIMDSIAEVFSEKQTYRIDHYLGKETVQNLLVLRFANTMFGKLWSNADIDHVQITVAEQVGLESRASYYERAGALRDMVQNHLLQLLCLVAMEPPNTLDADAIRDEKVRILKAIRPIRGNDVKRRTVRGLYEAGKQNGAPVKGYAEELGRASQVETFVAIKAEIDTWRWAGVPFYLRTGKRMEKRFSEIVITFKPVAHSIFSTLGDDGALVPNRLIIRLQPDDGVKFVTMAKIPGSGRLRLRETELDLRFGTAFGDRSPDAYERLLTDVLRGQQTLFMRRDEVESAWAFIDPITAAWEKYYAKPDPYEAGQNGPREASLLIERDGRSWYDPVDLNGNGY
jgi:glucose-6-phosphate 1-dehydrogenase